MPAKYTYDIGNELWFDATEHDAVSPTRIEHRYEEARSDGGIDAAYNYLTYVFEQDGLIIRARAYLHEPHIISVFEAHRKDEPGTNVSVPHFMNDVLLYFTYRFRAIERFSPRSDIGYVTVWQSGPLENEVDISFNGPGFLRRLWHELRWRIQGWFS